MSKFSNITNKVTSIVGRKGLVIKKHSPEILMVAGVVGVITGTVMACKATLKVDEVLDETNNKIERIKKAKAMSDNDEIVKGEYTEEDYKKDMTIAYVQTGAELVKLYAPAVIITVAALGCVIGSHNIMKKRNLALMAAYTAIEKSFNSYRRRVVEEFGTEKDYMYKNGIRKETVDNIEIDEKGKKHKVKEDVYTIDPNNPSLYARFFDESSVNWTKTPEYNFSFLKITESYMNDLLNMRGHVFLNEVYDAIGIPRTQAGAVVGWVKGNGADYIDFGIFGDSDTKRDFVNGYERSILLDFNVDGTIFDKI